MREYALANSLYWALAEGHACEQAVRALPKTFETLTNIESYQARRNAMDVCQDSLITFVQSTDHEILQNASKNAGDMIDKYDSMLMLQTK